MSTITKQQLIDNMYELFPKKGININFYKFEDFRFPDTYDMDDVQERIYRVNDNRIEKDNQLICPSGIEIKDYHQEGQYIFHKDHKNEWFLLNKKIAQKFVKYHDRQFCKHCGKMIRKSRKHIICKQCNLLPTNTSFQIYRGKCLKMIGNSILPWEQDILTLWRLQISDPSPYFTQIKTFQGKISFAEIMKQERQQYIRLFVKDNKKLQAMYNEFQVIMKIITYNLREVTIEGLIIY